jgi:phage terminase Nu1 subunit (DNA packaging protein)
MHNYTLPPEAGITELAEAAGLSRDRAKQVLDTAKIKRDKYRKYPTELAMQALLAFSDAGKSTGHALNGYGNPDTRNDHMQALAAARATAESARARKIELEVASKEGRLVSREAVNQAAVEFSTHIRNGLLGFPARIAHKLVGAADAEAIERVLDEAIREELAALSDIDLYALSD